MVWFILFTAGLCIIAIGLFRAIRSRRPDMLMLNGGVLAFIGFMGYDAWPTYAVLGGMDQKAASRILFNAAAWSIAAWTAYQFLWSLRALTWPSTSGVITHSASVFLGMRGSDVSGRRNSARHTWRVTYQYQVDGRTYTSSNKGLDTDEEDGDLSSANEKAREHPVGSTVRVFHHPREPQLACLDRSLINGRWLVPALLAGLLFWAASVV
ncbi:MAG: DUF3592 domain-containing protein [Flavobacteriales bacterium]